MRTTITHWRNMNIRLDQWPETLKVGDIHVDTQEGSQPNMTDTAAFGLSENDSIDFAMALAKVRYTMSGSFCVQVVRVSKLDENGEMLEGEILFTIGRDLHEFDI